MTRLRNFLPGAEPERTQEQEPDYDDMLGRPALTAGDGTSYYPISALAAALERTPGTIRTWEKDGVIPLGFVANPDSPRGRRRLYTRDQILSLRQLADECGILHDRRATVKDSEFSCAAHILFERLREQAA